MLMEGDFLHGVASGDPLHDAVIIWTRFYPREYESCLYLIGKCAR